MAELTASLALLSELVNFLKVMGLLDYALGFTATGAAVTVVGMWVKFVRHSSGGGGGNAYSRKRYYSARYHQ